MKRILLSCIALFSAVGSLKMPAQAQADAETKKPASPSVVISEVCYWPNKGEAEWIELSNISDQPVDIKGWQLVDGQTLDFVISEQSLWMPPASYLVIKLDGTAKSPTSFTQNRATIHSPRGVTGNLLGDKGGQIALYAPEIDIFNPAEIRSYVAWGRSPGRILSEALEAKNWSATSSAVFGTGPDIIMGPAKTIVQGGSIGLVESVDHWGYAHEHWGIFAPSEVNPGETGVAKRGPTLTPYAYDGATTDSQGYRNTSVVPMENGVQYQFQVSANRDFKETFLDHVGGGFDYRIEKPIPLHSTYFWRARLIYPGDVKSVWSEVRRLVSE